MEKVKETINSLVKKMKSKIKKKEPEETVQEVEGFQCTTCGKAYPTESGLRDHVKRMHE